MAAKKDNPANPREGTRYIVLQLDESSEDSQASWLEQGSVTAHNDSQAIRNWVGDSGINLPDKGALFIAVPERSWRKRTLKASVKTQLTLE